MLQDILPHIFNNEFKPKKPTDEDLCFIFNGNCVLLDNSSENLNFIKIKQLKNLNTNIENDLIYLFSIDNLSVFTTFEKFKETEDLKYIKTSELRYALPEWMFFTLMTAAHLTIWYDTNRFCGRCKTKMKFSTKERALFCPKCGLIKYPDIHPAIIVAITDNDKILLTRYASRPYKKWSLVAGYTEFGEKLEDTIKREVMEEVGLRVKNIRYFNSQPWALSQSLLMGFFAELDGDSKISLDKTELSDAVWFKREEIQACDEVMSLTNTMIETFRKNKHESILVN